MPPPIPMPCQQCWSAGDPPTPPAHLRSTPPTLKNERKYLLCWPHVGRALLQCKAPYRHTHHTFTLSQARHRSSPLRASTNRAMFPLQGNGLVWRAWVGDEDSGRNVQTLHLGVQRSPAGETGRRCRGNDAVVL